MAEVKSLVKIWIVCVFLGMAAGTSVKGGARGVKGGSQSEQVSRFSHTQVEEPLVTRNTYSQSQAISPRACDRPDPPMNGRVSCTMTNDRYLCKGNCNPGYKFPDGVESYDLECSKATGLWTPYRNFPDCGGTYGDGYEGSDTSYISSHDSRYGQSASGGQGSYSQSYSHGSSIKTATQALCGQPKSPMNGAHHCSMSNGQWTCQATCNPGYEFPDRSRQVSSICNDRDGMWSPKKDFDDCKLLCHPPCENGGRCAVHNQCMCPSSHRGNRCQYPVSLCDFNRLSSGTLYNDCTHNAEYTECRISCPPGTTFDPPSTSIYRCTVDGKWNPPIAPMCGRDTLCERPPPPTNGRIECRGSSEIMMCTGSCQPGYIFQDGFSELSIQCVKRTGEWTPTIGFPNCEAICSPECLNGGRCLGHNSCLCPREFRGSRCEYPLSNCDGHDRFASVAWQCQTNSKETVCSVSCGTGSTLQPIQPATYTCSLDGTWQPNSKPICVSDFSSLSGSRTKYERYEDHGQGSSWSSSSHRRTGYQEIEHRYSDEQQGIHQEFGGQQRIGHEFGGQQSVSHEFGGEQTMDNGFTGERMVSHESGGQQDISATDLDFGGQQRVGHEFGGQQVMGHDFGGQQRGGHEFGGQQLMGHDFGGQQRGGHEFGGQQVLDHEFGGQQRVGQEFGGQETVGHEFGGQQVLDREFGGQQMIGHEFGGQQSLDEIHFQEPIIQESRKTIVEASSGVKTSKVKLPPPQPIRLQEIEDELPRGKGVSYQREREDDTDEDSREILTQLDVGNRETKNINIFSSKRKASNFRGICSTWGFYHYRTFDGGIYTFPSSCWYILAISSVDDIVISLKSDCGGKTPCSRTVSIQHANNRYLLSYANGLSRNGISLLIPIQDGDLVVEHISRYLVARTNFGYTVWINEENSVLLVAESYIQNQTRGMCGNDNGNLDPFFLCEDGKKSSDIFEFATSWKIENLDGVCVDEVEAKAPCNSETREKRMVSDKANLACAAFFNAEFEACGAVLDVDVYYLKCQMDCCSTDSVENCECTSLAEFVLECSRAGVDMTRGWRQPGLCPLLCKNGTEYSECGPPCPPTCADQQPTCSQQKCVDGCHCPRGTVLEDGQCISVDDCPCHYAEKVYATGQTIQQDCNTCVCQGGNWQCTESVCPATCTLSGPHITTFDALHYDFHGRCPHYLVLGKDFSVQVDYTINCRGRNAASGVCVNGVTIQTPGEAIVKLKPNMEVVVNGHEMNSLPVLAPGIYVGQATSTYMRAHLKNGLEILWDLGSTIHIHAPVELFGVLKGLCGTFTKNQHDEFLTPEGDIETSSGVFAHKWRVEEGCRDVEEPNDPEGNEKACDVFPERRNPAAGACGVLKGDEFKECHDLLDYERYYSDCMEDVCSCQDEPVRCACLSLANYAAACARKEKPVPWRLAVPECGISCPHSQVYLACASPCSYSCGEIAHVHSNCRESCVEGCVCPPGQTLNDHGQCAPVSKCSCLHSGHFYPPEFLQRRGSKMCECSQGNWDCHKASPADLILTPPPHIADECDPTFRQVPTDCRTDCPLTCSNFHHHQPCTVAVCVPGCSCQEGFIVDTTTGKCVRPHECPCHHGGRSFAEGDEIKMDCNNCVCVGGSWKCDSNPCPGLCSAWGESHYETFDGHLFDFDGTCAYVLAKAKISEQEFFAVVVQNVPCGVGSGASCGKTVSVTLGDSSVALTRIHPLPTISVDSRLSVTSVGMFTLVDSDIGISVQWDRNTRVYVTAQPIWKNKLQGLCGDFNSDATDDFKSPSGGKPLVLAKDFADSWRVHKFCPQAKHPEDACEKNPERRSWSQQKCGVLKSDLFKPCHFQVEVEDYYKRCVLDACGCNSGGDCECLCAVVSTYAQKCARSGVVIPWRSQDLCPVQCEACDHYSPCISLCPPPNCDTYLNAPDSRSCNREYCVDGCDPKPCMPGHVHRSADNLTCVSGELCGDKPCIVIEGVPYREGERIDRADAGDACQSCYCRRGQVECMGVPCTYSTTTFQPVEFQVLEECMFTGWTEWINSISPEDNEGNDAETLVQLAKTHRIPCPLDHVKSIQCRSVETQEISEATGENVTCNIVEGMQCWKNARTGNCMDYEVKVYCQCHEEATCPPGQNWEECAYDCENSCQSLKVDLQGRGLCEGQKCVEGCSGKVCQHPYLTRDADTCVRSDQCTCRLESGYILAPGQVVTNGCEKCQCLNNTLICSTTVECRESAPEVVKSVEEEEEIPEQFEVVTFKPKPLPPQVTTSPSRGLVLTTPVCSYWSDWINKGKPKNGRRHGDREATRPYILKQTEGFCMKGSITEIECREAITDQDYTETNEEKLVCNLNKGFQCQNRQQPDERCQDYKIRYFCSCTEETTPVPLFIQTTTQTYVYPCVEFIPLIDGPNRLPDANLKASSSASSFSGPDGARFQVLGAKGARKTWTAGESNDEQFIEVDVSEVRGIYGIITKGKEFSSEWVTSYQILYSTDGVSYSYYQDENDNNKIFSGNFDDTNEVKHLFKRPFEAKFIRIEPLSWERKISLKLELLGCLEAITHTAKPLFPFQMGLPDSKKGDIDIAKESRSLVLQTTPQPPKECMEPIGLENGALHDSQFSATSSFSSVFTPENTRLGSDSVWAAAVSEDEQYLQIDFVDEANITGIITKGREDVPQWVTAFVLTYSKDGVIWNKIKDEEGTSLKEFSANYDPYTPVTNEFPAMIRARLLRIWPTNWKNWISMQMEILGCYQPQPCRDPMGVDEGVVTTYQLSSSSKISDSHSATHGRLSSISSWTPAKNDKNPFLQVDLLEPLKLTGMITKGDPEIQQWVKSYFIAYSNDSINWKKAENFNGKAKEFIGNDDQSSAVISIFPIPFTSRYVQIIPTKWHRWTSMRVELLGCMKEQECREPMGLENGVLSDGQMTASSSLDWKSTPSHARISDENGWIADTFDNNPYLQVDFLEPRNVSAVVTKGTEPSDFWVTKYKVLYSDDGVKWTPVSDDNGNIIQFPGNEDRDTPVVNTFPGSIEARYFRIIPLNYENKIGMRLELLGCYHPFVCQEPLGLESGTIYDFQITVSSSTNPMLGPTNARLDSDAGWVAELGDESPYLQVDFMTPTNITGLMTRGRNDANEWVKSYGIAYSNDGFHWSDIKDDNGDSVEFKGNFDNESPSTSMFPTPLFSRYLRIKPTHYEKKIGLRIEVLGCSKEKTCMEPMGLENGILSDSQITASSYKTDQTSPQNARLNSKTSWSAAAIEGAPQYLKVDFGEPRNVSGVVTKGNADEQEWVTAYQVSYSNDGDKWLPVRNILGEVIEFPGNTDGDSPVINVLPVTVEVQYIKIIPTDWKNWISIRAEILGCYHPYEPIVLTTEPEDEVLALTYFPTEPTLVAACPNPMEAESSLLKDATLQASSYTLNGHTSRIGLNTPGEGLLSGGWVPAVEDLHPVLLVQLPDVKWITSIFVQGREDEENWVKSLRVIASQDNKTWLPVFGPNGDEIIEGNEDQNSVAGHYFKRPMEAKYVKIIPETWHRWPSFRLDLRGCHMAESSSTVPPTPGILALCPELSSEPDVENNCPSECPPGLLCDGQACVDPVDCSCVHDGKIFKVSDKIEDHSCMQCDCALGGRTVCAKKVCPTCSENERSMLNDDCSCLCKPCEPNEAMCPSSHECIPKQRWCDGIVDCPDDETNCIFTTTAKPSASAELIIPTSAPIPENATCDVMGKHIKTFDGQDIAYDICHHVVMKEVINGAFNATLHKECDYAGDCKHWLELMHKRHNVKVYSDLKVEFNGHTYTASQLSRLSEKSKARNLIIKKVGDQVIIKSLLKGFTLVYDTNAHLKIEVPPTLKKRIGGLCGYYSGFPEDDQRKPDGKKAFTSREFGDSWTSDNAESDCTPLICPHEVMARALEQCNKLRSEPFVGCSKVLAIDHFIEFCMSSTCECMLHNKNSDEKCKCDSFQPFAEACENELGPTAIRNWRFIHRCHSECPSGMEWNDCGPSCQLTCDSNSELEQCSEKCVPGCFCPPGTVLSDDKCISPDQCADQLCQGFGDPHFMTFDGLFYPFQAEGSFLIVGDKENDFTLNGFSRRCNIFTHVTCLTGLQVLYKENKVTIKKHREIEVNDMKIAMDKLPLYSNGMVILGYPGRTFVVSIPLMNLEARYYEDNSGFAVKVPSQKYFNKTEGLCGNCNGKKDDELKEKPLSEFVCSFQTEGDPTECKKAMEELPVLNERVPLCKSLESPVFEACHPLVDYEVYIDACSFDATHSGDPKAAFCKTAIEYARQCCQAGISIEDWPGALECEMKCPVGLGYRQCHEGCPQTCASLKNTSQDSSCSQLRIDGCFCPEGKVLKGENCADSILCDTCDEDGHVPGDEWKTGKCKKCHCKSDLTTECVVEVCPNKPICSTHEMLARVNNEQEDSCCESYSCVPKIENCPQVNVPDCPKGEVAKITTRRDSCAEFRCECDPALCPPIVWPSDLEDGEVAEMVNDSCCRKMRVSCHPDSCQEKPRCRKGLELRETEGECCTKYKCKPPEDVCVYTNTYKIVDGLQVTLKSEDTTTSLHKPGDEWEDGQCEKCKCVQSNGQHAPLCVLEQCPRLEDQPENKDYVLHEIRIPGKCCPDIFRINCKDEDGNIYEEGEHWSDVNDPCINYMCEAQYIGGVQKSKNVINCTECLRTAVYFPPSKILGQCCGICQVTKCEDDEKLYALGDTWVSEDQPCRKAECIKDHGSIKIVYTRQPCPTIPKDCPKNQITWDDKGCCEICNATSEISCSTGPIPEEDTIGFFTYPDESHGGVCVNEKPVPNVLKCSGACHSQSYYSLEDGDFKDTCKCCKVNVTVNRTVDLVCPDRSRLKKTFVQPETCQCSKCAPKSGSRFIDKYQAAERPQPWRQSVKTAGFAQSPWENMQTSHFGQTPLEIGQQTEHDGDIEQIGRFRPGQEVQQQDYDNMFEHNREVQQQQDHDNQFEMVQQQQDHGNLFEPVQQQQQDHGNLFEPVQQQQQHHGNLFETFQHQQQDHD